MEVGYDRAGRLSTLTTPRGTTTYSYHATTGNLATVTAPGGVNLAYGYDGALLKQLAWTGPISGTIGYSYDNDFGVTSTGVNGANTVTYQYDADSLLTKAGDLTLNRDPRNGLLTGSTLGVVTDTISYNGFGESVSYSASVGRNSLYTVHYTRDKLGRISQQTETITDTTTTYAYDYDQAGRLAQVKQNSTVVATYTYNSNGNRLTAPGITNATYNSQDRLLTYGATVYTYTANGEQRSKTTSGQTTTYEYDVLGNMLGVTLPDGTHITYLVDGQNRRIGKRVNSVLKQAFLYDGQLRPIAELDGKGTVVSRFVYASHMNVPDYIVKGSVTYRILTDHLGSPRVVVNAATGAVAQRMDYDAWGNVLQDTNARFQPFGFAGGLYDSDTGLVRFGARDYDTETGRWTVKDPIGFEGGDADLYTYVQNDPVNLIDPWGQVWKLVRRVFGRGIEAIRIISRGQALRAYKKGIDVGTDEGPRAMRKLAKDASKDLGGGGKACLDPPHKPGQVPHAHGVDETGKHLEGGHIFDLRNLDGIILFIFDSNENGVLDTSDILDLVDPLPPIILPYPDQRSDDLSA